MSRPTLHEWLIDGFDPDQLVDLLGISSADIIDAFPDKVDEYLTCDGPPQFEEERDDNGKWTEDFKDL